MEELSETSQQLAATRFAHLPYTPETLKHYITALVAPKCGTSKSLNSETISPKLKHLTHVVQQALYNFSKGKLLTMLKEQPFAHLLIHYFRQESFAQRLVERVETKEAKVTYLNNRDQMKSICLSSL